MNPLTDAAGSFRFYTGLFLLGTLIGCSDGPSLRDPSWTLVPITDLNMVVGEWEGTVKKERATFAGGSVRLMIRENGTYLDNSTEAFESSSKNRDDDPSQRRDLRGVGM